MPGTLSPAPWFTGLDDAGVPLDGGLLYVYAAGTSSPVAVYSDVELDIPHSNPAVLDSAGRITLYLTELSYKYELRNRFGALIRTQDNVVSAGVGGGGGVGETFTFGGSSESPITQISYTPGATVGATHSGTGLMQVDSASLVGTFVLEAMMIVSSGNHVRCALMNLSDGDPDTPMVEIMSGSNTGERVVSTVITFPAAGTVKTYGIKVKVDAGAGYVWQVKLTRMLEA